MTSTTSLSVLIAGAGPVGLCFAIKLAREGYIVTILETQVEELFVLGDKPWWIVLNSKTLQTIKRHCDIEFTDESPNPNTHPFYKCKGNLYIPLDVFRDILLKEIRNKYKSPTINIHFSSNIKSYEYETGKVVVQQNNVETGKEKFSFVLLCTGTGYGLPPVSNYPIEGYILNCVPPEGQRTRRAVARTFTVTTQDGEARYIKPPIIEAIPFNNGPSRRIDLRIFGRINSKGHLYVALGLPDNFDTTQVEQIIEHYIRERIPLVETIEQCDKPKGIFGIRLESKKETVYDSHTGTIFFLEGDAARKPNFLSGSGLNYSLKSLNHFYSESFMAKTHHRTSKRDFNHHLTKKMVDRGVLFLSCSSPS